MRYPCPCGILVLALFLGCGHLLHAQDDSLAAWKDAWEATYANGISLSPIRSLGRDADSIVVLLYRSRVTQLGDTSIIRRSYEPLAIPLDSIRELRVSDGNRMGTGALAGLIAGALISFLVDQNSVKSAHESGVDAGGVLIGASVGTLAGILVGANVKDETIYDLDPLTPEQRRTLVQRTLAPASADELAVRPLDTEMVVGKQWGHLWVTAGAGTATWSSLEGGSSTPVPRFTFGAESPYVFLTGAFTSSSVRWFSMTELDLLAGKQFVAGPFTLAVAAGPCFIRSQVIELMPNPVEESDFKRSSSTIGGAASFDVTLPLTDYLGISAAAYSSISSHGPMFGASLSAKVGLLR